VRACSELDIGRSALDVGRFQTGQLQEQLVFGIPRHWSFSKRIVTKFFQDFLYFTEVPMRNIAALSST